MEGTRAYEQFLRIRITELRIAKDVSEHKMSMDLGKSGSYIRGITSGASLPSVRELFNICNYFNLSPMEFFASMKDDDSPRNTLIEKLSQLNKEDIEKVATFIGWIEK